MEPLNKLYFSRSAAYCFMDRFHNDLDKKLSICNAIAYEHSSHSEIEDSSEKENVLKDSKVLVDYQWSVEAVSLFRKENTLLYIFDLIEFTKMSYYPLSRKAKFINEFDDYFKVVHGITLETAQKINIRAGLERKGPNDYKILKAASPGANEQSIVLKTIK